MFIVESNVEPFADINARKSYPLHLLEAAEQAEVLKDVHIRSSNPMQKDTVQRVARDPIRKLGPRDSLVASSRRRSPGMEWRKP